MVWQSFVAWRQGAAEQQQVLALLLLAHGHWANRELAAGFVAFRDNRQMCQMLRQVTPQLRLLFCHWHQSLLQDSPEGLVLHTCPSGMLFGGCQSGNCNSTCRLSATLPGGSKDVPSAPGSLYANVPRRSASTSWSTLSMHGT